MQTFDAIYQRAAGRKGGEKALEKLLANTKPKSAAAIRKIPDDRWLSEMTRAVFRAGFVWRVVDNKWPAFEQAFNNFEPMHVAYLPDEAIDAMVTNADLIRHFKKLAATRSNASFILDIAGEHGSAGAYFASWSQDNYAELLIDLKKRASRLGGTSAQYFLRSMGVSSFVLSGDVVKALQIADVVTRTPSSQRDLRTVQAAFNEWSQQSGRELSQISRVLAMSVD